MDSLSYKYWAFISYSHRDRAWGDWLHKALETYRVPNQLVGTDSGTGRIPARLLPIFRDREELPASANLGLNIEEALKSSRFLIVICSPHAASSHWVNEEVIKFKSLGREDRVLACIVDGEPNASEGKTGFSPEVECFPAAMRRWTGGDGTSGGTRVEPIAADLRAGGDGRRNALLKLLAALLGVEFDRLRKREQERRNRRLRWVTAAAILLTGVFAVLSLSLFRQRNEVIRSQTETKRQFSLSDFLQADELVKSHQYPKALAFLAHSIRINPANRAAARRILFLLQQTPCLVPSEKIADANTAVLDVHYAPDGRSLLLLKRDGKISVYDSIMKRWLFKFIPLKGDDARFTSDGQMFADISTDGDALEIQPEATVYRDSHSGEIRAKPQSAVGAYPAGSVRQAPRGKELVRASAAGGKCLAIAYGEDLEHPGDTDFENYIMVYDKISGKSAVRFNNQRNVKFIGFSGDVRLMAVCKGAIFDIEECYGQLDLYEIARSPEITQWHSDANEWRRIGSFEFDNPVFRAAFSPDCRFIAVTCLDGSMHLVCIDEAKSADELTTASQSSTFKVEGSGVGFSPNGREMVAGDWRWKRVGHDFKPLLYWSESHAKTLTGW